MALNLGPDAQLAFFKGAFGSTHTVTAMVQALIGQGWKFETTPFLVKATSPVGNPLKVETSIGTTTLIKKTAAHTVLQANLVKVADFVGGLHAKYYNPAKEEKPLETPKEKVTITVHAVALIGKGKSIIETIKVLRVFTGCGLKEAKDVCDFAPCVFLTNATADFANGLASELEKVGAKAHVYAAGETNSTIAQKILPGTESLPYVNTETLAAAFPNSQVAWKEVNVGDGPKAPMAPPIPSSSSTVIPLRDAQALLQKVKGSTVGSVYYTIGFNERVKVAVRITGEGESKNLSFRVEMKEPTNEEQMRVVQALTVNGHSGWKGAYGSMHIDSNGVPLGRIVGAFLMGLGVKLTSQITFEGDLPINAK